MNPNFRVKRQNESSSWKSYTENMLSTGRLVSLKTSKLIYKHRWTKDKLKLPLKEDFVLIKSSSDDQSFTTKDLRLSDKDKKRFYIQHLQRRMARLQKTKKWNKNSLIFTPTVNFFSGFGSRSFHSFQNYYAINK